MQFSPKYPCMQAKSKNCLSSDLDRKILKAIWKNIDKKRLTKHECNTHTLC